MRTIAGMDVVRSSVQLLALVFAMSYSAAAQNVTVQVCTATMTTPNIQNPMSLCSIGGDATTFSGYDIELWRNVGRELGWVEGQDYEFKCMYFRDLLDGVQNGTCDVGLGAITVSTARQEAGYRFSFPTYSASLAVMVSVEVGGADGWFFIKPFSWDVWLAIGLTMLLFPVLLWFTDAYIHGGRFREYQGRYNLRGLNQVYSDTVWTSLLNGYSHFDSTSVRLMLLSFGVLATVVMNVYVAQLAAFLTVGQFRSTVNNIADLRGRATGATAVYQTRLLRASLVPAVYGDGWARALGTGSDLDWISHLRNKQLTAFVHDEPLLRSIDSAFGCDVRLLDETMDQFNYAFLFKNDTLMDVDEIDGIIQKLQEAGIQSQLRSTFITFAPAPCKRATYTESVAINMSQLYGVWVIFAAGVVVAILLAALLTWSRRTILPAISKRVNVDRLPTISHWLSAGSQPDAAGASNRGSPGSNSSPQRSAALAAGAKGIKLDEAGNPQAVEALLRRQLDAAQRSQEELQAALVSLTAGRVAAELLAASPQL